MNCSNCGREINNKQRFCIACGQENLGYGKEEVIKQPIVVNNSGEKQTKNKGEGQAIAGMILAIISLVFSGIFLSLYLLMITSGENEKLGYVLLFVLYGIICEIASLGLAIPALILSGISKRYDHRYNNLGTIGLTLSIISIALVFVYLFTLTNIN